jgi:hypothetical protein
MSCDISCFRCNLLPNRCRTTLRHATGTLVNGTATLKLPQLPATGTYTLDARVLDLAGNSGTSASDSGSR